MFKRVLFLALCFSAGMCAMDQAASSDADDSRAAKRRRIISKAVQDDNHRVHMFRLSRLARLLSYKPTVLFDADDKPIIFSRDEARLMQLEDGCVFNNSQFSAEVKLVGLNVPFIVSCTGERAFKTYLSLANVMSPEKFLVRQSPQTLSSVMWLAKFLNMKNCVDFVKQALRIKFTKRSFIESYNGEDFALPSDEAERLRRFLLCRDDISQIFLTSGFDRVAYQYFAMSADWRFFVANDREGACTVWQFPEQKKIVTWKASSGRIRNAVFVPGHLRLLINTDDDISIVTICGSRMRCEGVLRGAARDLQSMAVTPDGTRVITMIGGGTVCVWDLATQCMLKEFESDSRWRSVIRVLPDSSRVLIGQDGGSMRVLNLTTYDFSQTLPRAEQDSDSSIADLVVSDDGRLAVSCDGDNTICRWDLVTGTCLTRCVGCFAYHIALTSDGRYVVVGGSKKLCVYDLQDFTGDPVYTISDLPEFRQIIALPENKLLVTGERTYDRPLTREIVTLPLGGKNMLSCEQIMLLKKLKLPFQDEPLYYDERLKEMYDVLPAAIKECVPCEFSAGPS